MRKSLDGIHHIDSVDSTTKKPPLIALLLPSLDAGGIARVILHLARAFLDQGYRVDLLPCRVRGYYVQSMPDGARLIRLHAENSFLARLRVARLSTCTLKALLRPSILALQPSFTQRYLKELALYLINHRPTALLSANTPTNLLAIWARQHSGVPTRLIISEHTHLSLHSTRTRKWRWHYIASLVSCTYTYADGMVAVSNGVANDLAITANLRRDTIKTIYNPVVTPELKVQARNTPPHPWLTDDGPLVIVAAGRLKPQKNFSLLLRAFARVRQQRSARLIIFGEGEQRKALEDLSKRLSIVENVSLPGFTTNPYAAFSHAALFVLSSDWEGLSNVLIEAMACGCPVVSTDCPSGPSEILEQGYYGELVPVNDAKALAEAIIRTLDKPIPRRTLYERASHFQVKPIAEDYLSFLLNSRTTNNFSKNSD